MIKPLPTIQEIEAAYIAIGYKPLIHGTNVEYTDGEVSVHTCCPIAAIIIHEIGTYQSQEILNKATEMYGSARTAFMRGFDGHDLGCEDSVKECPQAWEYGKQ